MTPINEYALNTKSPHAMLGRWATQSTLTDLETQVLKAAVLPIRGAVSRLDFQESAK